MTVQLELPAAPPRTYGTYSYELDGGRGKWVLRMEPAVTVRAKRIFARVRWTHAGVIEVADSLDVTRDLEWLMERWPLEPANPEAAAHLYRQANAHRRREATIHKVVTGQRRLELPREPAKKPRDYQLVAVDLLRSTGRLLLTDSRGLGKTFTGLLNGTHEDALPMLVVPPAHLPGRWAHEAAEAFPFLNFQIAKKGTPPENWTPDDMPDVMIVPYSKLAGWANHLAGNFKTIVFDEVQELRTGRYTRKGMAAAVLCEGANYRLGLTATPIYNYGGEIWNILDILAPGELGTSEEFSREWGSASYNGKVRIKDPAALGNYLREEGLMLGRNRRDVGRELPPHVTVNVTVESDPEALEKVKGDAQAMAKLILAADTSSWDRMKAAGDLDWKLREATGIGKAPYVAEFVRLLLESEDKIVLFGWHRAVYDIWQDLLAEFNPAMYTGSESATQKDAAAKAFTTDPECRVLLMSLRSGSGVDGLQEVSKVCVFGELDWSPQVHLQGIGRLDRDPADPTVDLTQVDPTVAYYLTTEDGSDPVLVETLGIKRNQSEPMLNPDGKLTPTAAPDAGRARALAMQILGETK
ncbi:DNA helicase [Arthrobacter phage KBurrousTX]|uniref:DNA helicase n=1 Tax=Arthrobacter phage KBurrousTX TaxID=2315608 RepID=A0A386K9X8_9CAUD|nr:DNA helicase [Arthrobacter phage KBurrousTX]AYD81582.1 DNA helicase [Arthrobacter phage KBurrousTX]